MRHCLGAVGDTISDSCVLFLIQQEVLHTVPKPTVHSRILEGIFAHFGAEICSNPLFPITVTLSAGAAKSSMAKVSKGSRRRHRGAVCRDQRSGRSERASGAAAGKGRVRCATRACECALPCSGRESPVERARAEHVHIICRGRRRARRWLHRRRWSDHFRFTSQFRFTFTEFTPLVGDRSTLRSNNTTVDRQSAAGKTGFLSDLSVGVSQVLQAATFTTKQRKRGKTERSQELSFRNLGLC